jgi:hypothetical protein
MTVREAPGMIGRSLGHLSLWRNKTLKAAAKLARRGEGWLDEDVYGAPPKRVAHALDELGLVALAFLGDEEGSVVGEAPGRKSLVFAAGLAKGGRHVPLRLGWGGADVEAALGVIEKELGPQARGSWEKQWEWSSCRVPKAVRWMDEQRVFFWKAEGVWRWGAIGHAGERWTVKHPKVWHGNFQAECEAIAMELMLSHPRAREQAGVSAIKTPEQELREEQIERGRLALLVPEELVERALAGERAWAIQKAAEKAKRKSLSIAARSTRTLVRALRRNATAGVEATRGGGAERSGLAKRL